MTDSKNQPPWWACILRGYNVGYPEPHSEEFYKFVVKRSFEAIDELLESDLNTDENRLRALRVVIPYLLSGDCPPVLALPRIDRYVFIKKDFVSVNESLAWLR